MKLGDTFTLPCTYRRKWWQFWKPRTWTVERTFTVTHVSHSMVYDAGGCAPPIISPLTSAELQAIDRAHVEAGMMTHGEYVKLWGTNEIPYDCHASHHVQTSASAQIGTWYSRCK